MRLPFPLPLSTWVYNLPYINVVPEAKFDTLWEEANLTVSLSLGPNLRTYRHAQSDRRLPAH